MAAALLKITKEKTLSGCCFLSSCLSKTRCFNTTPDSSGDEYLKYTIPSRPFDKISYLKQTMKNLVSSSFAAAVGFWPEQEARYNLWLEKHDACGTILDNEETWCCPIWESYALERYQLITGNNVIIPPLFQVYGKGEDDYLAASSDGMVLDCTGKTLSRGVLKVKCPDNQDPDYAFLTKPWDQIPLFMIPEAQGLMEIMDTYWMDLYVWTPLGSNLFRLYRDAEYWKALHRALNDFWYCHVQPAKMLEYYPDEDYLAKRSKLYDSLTPNPSHPLYKHILDESKRIVSKSRLLARSRTSPVRQYVPALTYSNLGGLEYMFDI